MFVIYVETTKREQHRALIYSQGYTENYTEHFRNVLVHNTGQPPAKFRLVCYYNFPANDRSMQISEIDPNLCTHLNVAFASVMNHSIYLDDRHLGKFFFWKLLFYEVFTHIFSLWLVKKSINHKLFTVVNLMQMLLMRTNHK